MRQQPSAPGPGNMGDGMQKVSYALQALMEAQKSFPPGTPAFKDINQAIGRLQRHMAQGSPAAGSQMTFLRDLIRGLMRNFNLQQVMAQAGGQGNASPAMGGGPSPSPALPGA